MNKLAKKRIRNLFSLLFEIFFLVYLNIIKVRKEYNEKKKGEIKLQIDVLVK